MNHASLTCASVLILVILYIYLSIESIEVECKTRVVQTLTIPDETDETHCGWFGLPTPTQNPSIGILKELCRNSLIKQQLYPIR